jgi:hypothetical protein
LQVSRPDHVATPAGSPAHKRERSGVADLHARDCISAILFGAIFNQLASDFDVVWKWSAGAQFAEPLFSSQIRESPKAEYRNVDGVSFARRRVFDEITPASRAVMLNERFAGLDFYTTPFSASPAVAVPFVATHGNKTSARQKSCEVTNGNLMRRPALWQVVSKQSEAILPRAISFSARGGFLFDSSRNGIGERGSVAGRDRHLSLQTAARPTNGWIVSRSARFAHPLEDENRRLKKTRDCPHCSGFRSRALLQRTKSSSGGRESLRSNLGQSIANRLVARISSRVMPESDGSCPASSTITSLARGHTRLRSPAQPMGA